MKSTRPCLWILLSSRRINQALVSLLCSRRISSQVIPLTLSDVYIPVSRTILLRFSFLLSTTLLIYAPPCHMPPPPSPLDLPYEHIPPYSPLFPLPYLPPYPGGPIIVGKERIKSSPRLQLCCINNKVNRTIRIVHHHDRNGRFGCNFFHCEVMIDYLVCPEVA